MTPPLSTSSGLMESVLDAAGAVSKCVVCELFAYYRVIRLNDTSENISEWVLRTIVWTVTSNDLPQCLIGIVT